ncbi:MAG: tetratricopeptide repeat protein [Treponema sp.]|nr:tetratricopeptide repeat protein [Treponema sp.]
MSKETSASLNDKVESFILKNRTAILAVIVAAVVAGGIACAVVGTTDAANKKGLAVLDAAEYAFTNKSDSLSDAEIAARQEKALEACAKFTSKKGILGVRSNMLAADIAFGKKDYAQALENYLAAVNAGKKYYTASINLFNAAVCAEETGDMESAANYYEQAAEDKDFYLAPHSLFNAARVRDEAGKAEEAAAIYKKVTEKFPNDDWANAAQSRIIDLQSKGKIE